MANIMMPAAGRSLVPRTEEFSFNTVREVNNTGCENILNDYKYGDCSNGCPYEGPNQIFQMQPPPPPPRPPAPTPHQQQQYHQLQQQHQQQPQLHHPALLKPQYLQEQQEQVQISNQWPHPTGTSASQSSRAADADTASVSKVPKSSFKAKTLGATLANRGGLRQGDQKRPTVPMSNCDPLCCAGSRCACLAPEDAIWGEKPFDVSTCWWTQGRETAKMRVRDPQVVRPYDRSLPEDTRPTGHPYFNHGAPTCTPHEAPILKGSGFNYEQWLATRQDREPPAHLRNQCISSLCAMCGPVTLECCPGYQIPQNYMLAKKV